VELVEAIDLVCALKKEITHIRENSDDYSKTIYGNINKIAHKIGLDSIYIPQR